MYTGSLGSVIKESFDVAYTFARSFLHEKLGNDWLFRNDVHVHAPSGASKKDGPNDAITLVTALISLGKLGLIQPRTGQPKRELQRPDRYRSREEC